MNFVKATIIIYIVGAVVFNLLGVLGDPNWHKAFYVWAAFCAGGFLMYYSLYKVVPATEKWVVRPMVVLTAIKAVFTILAVWRNWNLNNDLWLGIMMVSLAIASGYLCFNEESRAHKWLNRYLP